MISPRQDPLLITFRTPGRLSLQSWIALVILSLRGGTASLSRAASTHTGTFSGSGPGFPSCVPPLMEGTHPLPAAAFSGAGMWPPETLRWWPCFLPNSVNMKSQEKKSTERLSAGRPRGRAGESPPRVSKWQKPKRAGLSMLGYHSCQVECLARSQSL